MSTRTIVLAVACSALAFGCAEQRDSEEETREIIGNLSQAGFPDSEITVIDGIVYAGGDAAVSLEASREMLEVDEDTSEEQYRTHNLVSRSVRTICIDRRACANHSAKFAEALAAAIANYSRLNLTFNMASRTTNFTGCNARITCRLTSGAGGHSGFPSGGHPFGTINIGTGLDGFNVNTVEHVMTHELGHTIGFRHSDWFNRSISCGVGGNEGAGADGAVHIPNTPTGATVGGSIMNACFRRSETGEFTASDIRALNQLYGL